eukprot:CAMPEP_0171100536 /NCGR_PEP_ID=MMETSP0766_2-20121228/53010_1 /TAXON_ID=439317 /ORGANISM="Gambierdiscus australes, Strain CAWD 149" /LENGTH=580 /DNA_ID=CAMNT_0011560381 /DNA_START=53 /DNA_END=1795 /DNA_ORIENTATION=-
MATRVMLLHCLFLVCVLSSVASTTSDPALLDDDECSAVNDQCGLNALQHRVRRVMHSSEGQCGPIGAPENDVCREPVTWAAGGGRWDPNAAEWFKDMLDITGMDHQHGTLDDYQRLFFCSPPGGKACGLPPCGCSHPPCDKCVWGGNGPAPAPAGCGNSSSIDCGPPETAMGYKGRQWPSMNFTGTGEMHVFAIGDWGGMDGSLNPIENRARIIAYSWGAQLGPSVFPRTRWNLDHSEQLCSHHEFVECFNSRGQDPCAEGCGYVEGVDSQPQILVANALKARASEKDPQFLLNVGDNFYWGGIEKTCGTPMGEISYTAHHQFDQIFERVYQGVGLDNKPWLSVLGNHDWGGRVFNNGWDQQIAYTWVSKRWILPAPYWSQHVEYPDLDFSIDFYMLDSNFIDAVEPSEDPEHNICGEKHNPADADCSVADGPASIETCPQYFADLWEEQKMWVLALMAKSQADWQIVVTHFPCGHEQGFYRRLHQEYGLDLLVTGHRHDQEIWLPTMYHKNFMGGLTCIVTGGGGGITSEATPNPDNTTNWYGEAQYGFYDLLITKEEIIIQSINFNGTNVMNATVHKR